MNNDTSQETAREKPGGADWAEKVWAVSWTYIRTVVDTIREPFVILDERLRVIAANETFYRTFQVPSKDTEKKSLFELGDGQWDIPALRTLLEDVLSKDTFFRGFEVKHEFPTIGRKVMLLNARRVHQSEPDVALAPHPIILLAIEDITEITDIAEKLSGQTKNYEAKMIERTEELELRIVELAEMKHTVAGLSTTVTKLTAVIEGLKRDIIEHTKHNAILPLG